MKNGVFVIGVLLFAVLFAGCPTDGESPSPNDAKLIVLFRVGDTDGVIDHEEGTITLSLPHNVSDFSPVIEVSKGATVEHIDGNFPGSAVYRVTAEDGSTRDYLAIVSWRIEIGIIPQEDAQWDYSADTLTLYKTGTPSSITIRAAGEYDGYEWLVDNEVKGITDSIVLDANNFEAGKRHLSLIVRKGTAALGVYYSKELIFTVEN
jgi:hypothetical protein